MFKKIEVPSWILPVVPVQPDSVHLLSSLFGSQANCHRLPDAQPQNPVRLPTNCLPLETTDLSILELTSPPRLINPPARRTNRWSSPEFLTHVIILSEINILNFIGLLEVSACRSKSLVKR
ncbi:hypothetical protein ILYODFUR_024338 [Ilyodon furcidens]|uniref:Uncharacterized protein n=1 Tax=Ilyodon furcidens TaxID=33524 RepID=A0ABV0TXB8_9TELE